jgi:Uma2 family endonuclease
MKAIEVRRWTREEYDKMIAAGVFSPGERSELVDGEIFQMTPQGSAHFTAIRLAEEAVRRAFGTGFEVRAQAPLALSPYSEPEPDIAVVRGSARDYRDAHPETALLLIEVSDTTLEHDRLRKGSLYARARIQDYWIINLLDRCVEVYRNPDQGSYRSSQRFLTGDRISPVAAPDAEVCVADLIP